MKSNTAAFYFADASQIEHLRVIYKNNPESVELWQLIRDNNPRGRVPLNNPTEWDDLISSIARFAGRLQASGKYQTWEEAAGDALP